MKSAWLRGVFAASTFVLVIAHGIASAQEHARPEGGEPALPSATRVAPRSPAEQLSQVESLLSKTESTRAVVRRQLESARARRDVVKTSCVDDKLNQIDVALRSMRERKEALERAVERDDAEVAGHEYSIASVLHQRTEQLGAEARLCIGKDPDGDRVTPDVTRMWIEPGLPPEDPSEYPPDSVVTALPGCASCVL